jgi:tRNA threonylcarbamoyladenosine biosynthesis protein TsaB
LVLGVKLVGVPSMDAIAERKSSFQGLVVPILDAHKGNVYSCIYEKDVSGKMRRKTDYLLIKVGELLDIVKGKAVFYGNGLKKYRGEIEKCPLGKIDETSDWHPRAEDIGRIGYELADSLTVLPEDLEPMYLYPRECNVIKREEK